MPIPAAALAAGIPVLQKFFSFLTGGDGVQQAGNEQLQGITNATNQINQGGERAMSILKPFLQGGTQDYGTMRDMVNSGYFNQAYPGSYQPPQAPTNVGYKPTWNAQTNSYENNRPVYQAPTMDRGQNMSLPQFRPTQPQLNMQDIQPIPQRQQSTPKQWTEDEITRILKLTLEQGRSINPVNLKDDLMTKTGQTQNYAPGSPQNQGGSKPWTMTPQQMIEYVLKNKGGSGPFNPQGGTTMPTFGGFR